MKTFYHTITEAEECAEYFTEYGMYIAYCAQFGTTTNNKTGEVSECEVIPIPEDVWNTLIK